METPLDFFLPFISCFILLYFLIIHFRQILNMKQISAQMVIVATLFILQTIVGCEDRQSYALREIESKSHDAVVVAKCECVVTTNSFGLLECYFRATEIWRDESDGLFTNKIGDFIGSPLGVEEYELTSNAAVQFFTLNDRTLYPTFTTFIYNEELLYMPVDQAKHIISTTSYQQRK